MMEARQTLQVVATHRVMEYLVPDRQVLECYIEKLKNYQRLPVPTTARPMRIRSSRPPRRAKTFTISSH